MDAQTQRIVVIAIVLALALASFRIVLLATKQSGRKRRSFMRTGFSLLAVAFVGGTLLVLLKV